MKKLSIFLFLLSSVAFSQQTESLTVTFAQFSSYQDIRLNSPIGGGDYLNCSSPSTVALCEPLGVSGIYSAPPFNFRNLPGRVISVNFMYQRWTYYEREISAIADIQYIDENGKNQVQSLYGTPAIGSPGVHPDYGVPIIRYTGFANFSVSPSLESASNILSVRVNSQAIFVSAVTVTYITDETTDPTPDLRIANLTLKKTNGEPLIFNNINTLSEGDNIQGTLTIGDSNFESISGQSQIDAYFEISYESGDQQSFNASISAASLKSGNREIPFNFTPNRIESFTILATIDPNNSIEESEEGNNTYQGNVGLKLPDLSIDIQLESVVGQHFLNPISQGQTLRVVQNRSADLLGSISVVGDDNTNIPDNAVLKVDVRQDNPSNSYSFSTTLGNVRDGDGFVNQLIGSLQTNSQGTSSISVSLNFEDEQYTDPEPNNNTYSFNLDFTEMSPINIGFVNFTGCFNVANQQNVCYDAVDPSEFSSLTPDLIQKIYPVADNSVSYQLVSVDEKGSNDNVTGFWNDTNLLNRIKLRSLSVNRMVGLVSDDYFVFHEIGEIDENGNLQTANGAAYLSVFNGAMFVKEGTPSWVVAHELGHTLTLDDFGDENGIPVSNVYDAEIQEEITNATSVMGEYGPTSPYPSLTPEDYFTVFNFLAEKEIDPEIIIISGVLSKDGSIAIDKTIYSDKGIISPNPGNGNVEFKALDSEGNLINSINFGLNFKLAISPGEIQDVDQAPFTFSIPYDERIQSIDVLVDGINKISYNPNSGSLVDTIESIQLNQIKARKDRIAQARLNLLIKKAKYYEKLIEKSRKPCKKKWWQRNKKCHIQKISKKAAEVTLKFLEKGVKRWMNDEEGLETNRRAVLNLINRIRKQ